MAEINDVVLVYLEDNPLFFARVEEILPDSKPDWFHLKLLILQLPLQAVTWILKDIYINGEEFTMNGKKMRIEKVLSPESHKPENHEVETQEMEQEKTPGGGKIISFSEIKKE